jgi:hypothetical protein
MSRSHMIWVVTPPPSPVTSTGDTQKDLEIEAITNGRGGKGVGEEPDHAIRPQ